MTNQTKTTDYVAAAEGQAFFAKMAALKGDDAAAKAHWDLALNYQRNHISQKDAT